MQLVREIGRSMSCVKVCLQRLEKQQDSTLNLKREPLMEARVCSDEDDDDISAGIPFRPSTASANTPPGNRAGGDNSGGVVNGCCRSTAAHSHASTSEQFELESVYSADHESLDGARSRNGGGDTLQGIDDAAQDHKSKVIPIKLGRQSSANTGVVDARSLEPSLNQEEANGKASPEKPRTPNRQPMSSNVPANDGAAAESSTAEAGQDGRRDGMSAVWFEFLDAEHSACPVKWQELEQRLEDGDSCLVYRPGREGWETLDSLLRTATFDAARGLTPRDALADDAAGGAAAGAATDAAADAAHGDAEPVDAAEEGFGIAGPFGLRKGVSVRYDPVTGGLIGLPEPWKALLPDGCTRDTVDASALPPMLRVPTRASRGMRLHDAAVVGQPFNVHRWRPAFGIPLEHVESTDINGFEIPRVLLTCRRALVALGGLQEEGIFRVSPDSRLSEAAVDMLSTDPNVPNDGMQDPHVVAYLIKLWFRQLPVRLLSAVSEEAIVNCSSGAEAMQLLHQCGDLRKGVFMWLLDLMSEVVEHQSSNRMSAEAIAIVMAPNLCTLPHGANVDQVRELEFGKRVAKFVVALLHHYDTVKTRLCSAFNGSPNGDGASHSPVTKDGSVNGRIAAAV